MIYAINNVLMVDVYHDAIEFESSSVELRRERSVHRQDGASNDRTKK
jgi:hypothetical protein